MAKITVTESGTIVMVGENDIVFIDIPGGGDVTIIADPASDVKTFTVKFVGDDQSDSVSIVLPTFDADDLQIDIKQYDPGDSISLVGSYDANVDPNDTDDFRFSYVGSDGQEHAGFVHAKDGNAKDFTTDPSPIIICFAAGTLIDTNRGPVAVEDLKEWDCARTVDNGVQPIRWIGHTRLDLPDLAAAPHLRPIIVSAGALGPGLPTRPLVLSPNHRVLVSGWQVETMFGEAEVLVPIKALIDGHAIRVDTAALGVDYYHVLLDAHELLYANGLIAESLFLAEQSEQAITQGMTESHDFAAAELSAACREMTGTARPALRTREAKLLSAA